MQTDYEKITQLLNFFIRKNSNSHIQKLKAIKLLWAADRYHIRKYGRLVSRDEYCAMKYGPVASTAKDVADLDLDYLDRTFVDYINEYIKHDDKRLTLYSHKDVETSNFSKTDIEALEFAWEVFGGYDGFEIADISHDYPEWVRFKDEIESGQARNAKIKYEDFFEDPKSLKQIEKDPFSMPHDLLTSSKELFLSTN